MAETGTTHSETQSQSPPPFGSILCAVDGSRGSQEAMRQAIALAGAGAALRFVAVANEVSSGSHAQVDLSERRAREALGDAVAIAAEAGVEASSDLLFGAPTSDLLLADSREHDLLAIGCHDGPRLGGVVAGSTATQIAHRTVRPLLVARPSRGGSSPAGLMLATDGSAGSWAAARVATRLAQASGSELSVVYVPDGMHPERYREVLRQLTVIEKALGSAPAMADDPGHVAERITAAADAADSSLVVIGHRGLQGVRALGSVSERVVHRAHCSVLVVPADGADQSRM